MQYHRGTVQKQIIQTIDTQCRQGVVVDESESAYSRNYGSKGKIQDSKNVADTLQTTMGESGGNVPLVENEIKKIEISQTVNEKLENNPKCIRVGEMGEGGGYVPMIQPNNKTEIQELAPTQTSCCGSNTSSSTVLVKNEEKKEKNLRIRKLTPKECWRLMGFTDEEFEKAEKVNSNSQLYKQAGNSIVVNVLQKILENLLKGETNE